MEMGFEDYSGPHWCEALYEARAPGLILYGRALGLSHGESEDVVHEVFAQLLTRDQPPREATNYCVRAFRNRAMNHHRSLWRRLSREFEFQRWFQVSGEANDHEVRAMKCLEKLPPLQREVIVLKIWNQHTFEEIGQLLELSANTVAGRYRYGIEKLRHCLKSEYDEQRHFIGENLGVLDAQEALPET